MKIHVKNFLDAHGLTGAESIPCMICKKSPIVDVHHINGRIGQNADNADNLIGLCRSCHTWVHANNSFELKQQLSKFIKMTLQFKGKLND